MNFEKGARRASRADSVGIIIQVHLEIAEEPCRWQALPGKGLQGAGTILLKWDPAGWVVLEWTFQRLFLPLGSPAQSSEASPRETLHQHWGPMQLGDGHG